MSWRDTYRGRIVNIRFSSIAAYQKVKRAARLARKSLNQFCVDAATEAADRSALRVTPSKTGLDLVMEVVDACTDCRKYNGALAVEMLKRALAAEGIATSGRDCYVNSLDIEWDLLVLREGARAAFDLLYEPDQVKVALEVKLSGVIADAVATTRRKFELARDAGVRCCYVSFCDRRTAAVTTEKMGFPCFNLTWSHGPKPRKDSGEWPMLVKFLRSLNNLRPL